MSLAPINDADTATSPIDGLGTIFEYATYTVAAGVVTIGTYNQVANLVDIKPHSITIGKVKTSTHSTTGSNTYRPMGLGEPGETEYSLLYDKTAYGVLAGLANAKTPIACRITYKDSATDVTLGFISDLKTVTPMEGDATIDCKVTHSGDSTITTA
jgi:hypothetical protein